MKIMQDGMTASVFRDDLPARIILQSVFGMCNWAHKWFRQDGQLSPSQVGEIFYEIVLDGIKKRV